MMRDLIKLLKDGNHSLVIEKDGEILTFDGQGISDLYKLLKHNPHILCGASAADKIVGKAAAALIISGKVNEVFADIISEGAISLLGKSSVKVTYGKAVPYIINRSGTGLCPLETLCKDCKNADECIIEIEHFINDKKH